MGEIYKITNKINGKSYIGKTKHQSIIRWRDHINGYHPNSAIHKAIVKYGVVNFTFDVLETNINDDSLNELEIYYIQKYKSKSPNGYNLTDGGDGGLGFVVTNEWRKKQSDCRKGLPWSDNRRKAGQTKLIGNNNASKPVVMLDKNSNKILAIYNSSTQASQKTGIGRTAINKAVRHTLKTAGGYKWEYLEKGMMVNEPNNECKKRCFC